MAYGDWVGGDDTTETTQDAPATESETPATDQAQGHFWLLGIATFILGFAFPVAWAGTAVAVVALLVSPAVGSLEASSRVKARSTGGGGGDVLLAGVIIVLLAAFCFALLLSLTENGL